MKDLNPSGKGNLLRLLHTKFEQAGCLCFLIEKPQTTTLKVINTEMAKLRQPVPAVNIKKNG